MSRTTDWISTTLAVGSWVILLAACQGQLFLLGLLSFVFGHALHGWTQRRMWVEGEHRHCAACGYDLTGVPRFPVTRCPECGQDYASAGVQTFFLTPAGQRLEYVALALKLIPIALVIVVLYGMALR